MFPDFYRFKIVQGTTVLAQWVAMSSDDVYLEEELFPGMGTEFRKIRHLTEWLEENQSDCSVVTTGHKFYNLD